MASLYYVKWNFIIENESKIVLSHSCFGWVNNKLFFNTVSNVVSNMTAVRHKSCNSQKQSTPITVNTNKWWHYGLMDIADTAPLHHPVAQSHSQSQSVLLRGPWLVGSYTPGQSMRMCLLPNINSTIIWSRTDAQPLIRPLVGATWRIRLSCRILRTWPKLLFYFCATKVRGIPAARLSIARGVSHGMIHEVLINIGYWTVGKIRENETKLL